MLANFLTTFKDNIKEFESGSNNKNIQGRIVEGRREQEKEAVANEMFLNQKFKYKEKFNEKFDGESIEKSDQESDNKSNNKSDKKYDKKSNDKADDKFKQNNKAKVDLTAIYSIIYTRKKPIRILNEKAMIPK